MKKYLLIVSSVLLIGITACRKATDQGVVSSNAQTTAPTNPGNGGNGRPVLGVPMNYANWQVGRFIENETELTSLYLNYVFHFDSNNVMTIARLDINRTIMGTWAMSEASANPGYFTIQVNPTSDDEVLRALNGTWSMLSFDVNSSIELVMGSKRLRLVRA